jgi:hypothetical protein
MLIDPVALTAPAKKARVGGADRKGTAAGGRLLLSRNGCDNVRDAAREYVSGLDGLAVAVAVAKVRAKTMQRRRQS